MRQPHIQVILADETVPPVLHQVLQRIEATAGFWPMAEAIRPGRTPCADALILVVPAQLGPVRQAVETVLERVAERPRATLVMTSDGSPAERAAHPATVPVTFAGAWSEDELLTRLNLMLELRHSFASLHREVVTNRQSERTTARRYQTQLRLASQVQREFLPERLPSCGRFSFQALYRPVEFVSGDLYDVTRLDPEHVAIAVADATGHGIPAALLTVFIKRALRGTEREGGTQRIIAPDEVLRRLNSEILAAELSECRFVAITYAVLNTRTGVVRLARGGTPYPMVRRAGGQIDVLRVEGSVVGVLPDARFDVAEFTLAAGDTLLLCTDGIDSMTPAPVAIPERILRRAARATRIPAMVGALLGSNAAPWQTPTPLQEDSPTDDGTTAHVGWLGTLQEAGTEQAFRSLGARFDMLRRVGHTLDDLTVVAVDAGV